MNRFEVWMIHASTILVGGTGLVYAWMRYLMDPVDEFAVINHPWQPHLQHLHLWLAPLLVFALGLIWRDHVWRHYKRGVKRRRRTGLTLLAACAPMVISGYLIQTSVSSTWRTTWIAIHLVTSGLFVGGYLLHQLIARNRSAES